MKKSLWFIVGLYSLVAVSTIFAHGLGKQQLRRVEAGDFLITSWSEPEPPLANEEFHITIAVEHDNQILLNANVNVTAIQNETEIISTANHDDAENELYYEATLKLDTIGTWQIMIDVEDNDDSGTASFEINVEENTENSMPWKWIILGIIGISLFGLIGINRLQSKPEDNR